MINNLKFFRKAKGYTQKELAYICGVSRNTICSLERGEYLPGVVLYKKINYVLTNYFGDTYSLSPEDISELRQKMDEVYSDKHYLDDPCT